MLLRRATFFSHLLIAVVALWQGLDLAPTLVNGYVLIALPAVLARAVAVICLGCAVCLGLLALRDGDRARNPGATDAGAERPRARRAAARGRWPLGRPRARCRGVWQDARRAARAPPRAGSHRPCCAKPGPSAGVRASSPACGDRSSAAAVAARGAKRRARRGVCRQPRGHRPCRNRDPPSPRALRCPDHRRRCYGDLVTLDPTGVVLVRTPGHLALADLFRSWGEPLTSVRLASFSAPAHGRIAVFIDGRPWHGAPGRVPLTPMPRSCSKSGRTFRPTRPSRSRRNPEPRAAASFAGRGYRPGAMLARFQRGAALRRAGSVALMPAAAFAVHQLRYWLAFGSRAGLELREQGHSYLHSVVPWIVLLIAIALGAFLCALGRAWGGRRSVPSYTISFVALWLTCSRRPTEPVEDT